MKAAIDNDILFKGACYGRLQDVADALHAIPSECGVLGAARFVLREKINRTNLCQDRKTVAQGLEAFLKSVTVLEPGRNEQVIAAQLESSALELGLSLDVGESQLCAMVMERAIPRLVTGDKRAILALEQLISVDSSLLKLQTKILCLEQLLLLVLVKVSFSELRVSICREPEVDKVMTICFSCRSANSSEQNLRDGLGSYIRDIQSAAPTILLGL
jgi:hypothetical protein